MADSPRQALGLEAQREGNAQYVKVHGYLVPDGFAFEEIESASSPGDFTIVGTRIELAAQRAAFMAMVGKLTHPKCTVKILVVQTLDRLSRNPVDEMLVTELIKAGVELHLVRDRLIINKGNWHQHRFGVRARGLMAAEEGDVRTQRIHDARRHKAE